jgi:hypothetical protein
MSTQELIKDIDFKELSKNCKSQEDISSMECQPQLDMLQ